MCDNVSLIITTIITNNTANSETDARLFCPSERAELRQIQSCTKICEQYLFLLQHSDKSGDDNHLADVNTDKHNCLD